MNCMKTHLGAVPELPVMSMLSAYLLCSFLFLGFSRKMVILSRMHKAMAVLKLNRSLLLIPMPCCTCR